MVNSKEALYQKLNQIIDLANECLGSLSGEVKSNRKSQEGTSSKEMFKGATGGLRQLISNGFFDQKHDFGAITQALIKNNYHYSKQAIQTPLNRLSTKGGPLVSLMEGGRKVYAKRK